MKRQWEHEELVEYWTLDVEDRALLDNKTGATRLGFAVLLKFFRREGRFPQHKNEVPGIVITFLATQVGVDATAYMQYAQAGDAPSNTTVRKSARRLAFVSQALLMANRCSSG
jgi:Domain of unknown function (DUF4158)